MHKIYSKDLPAISIVLGDSLLTVTCVMNLYLQNMSSKDANILFLALSIISIIDFKVLLASLNEIIILIIAC